MGKIIEITETHIIIQENNIKYKVKKEFVKFEPRLNDIVTLARNEEGRITNIFLSPNKVDDNIILGNQEMQMNERDQHFLKQYENYQKELDLRQKRKALFASKFVAIYSLVFWGLIFIGVIPSLRDQSLFIDLFTELGLELYLVPIVLYIMLGLSIGIILLSSIILIFKNKKVKLIFIIPLLVIYSIMTISSIASMFAMPSMGFGQLVFFGLPLYYSIRFVMSYKIL